MSSYSKRYTTIFAHRYQQLTSRFLILAQQDPTGYANHPEVKFFKRVRKCMDTCLADPGHSQYLLGKTLGDANQHWRRIKKDMPDRYRLFFQFSSEQFIVIFCWLNDQRFLRRAGHKNDVYAVFKKMLDNGVLPNSFTELLKSSTPPA
jgi:toxin YhaV